MELKEDQSLVLSREEAIVIARHFHGYYYRAMRKLKWERNHHAYLLGRGRDVSRVQRAIKNTEDKANEYREWENLYELLFKNKRIKPNTTTRMVHKDKLPSSDEETIYEQLES